MHIQITITLLQFKQLGGNLDSLFSNEYSMYWGQHLNSKITRIDEVSNTFIIYTEYDSGRSSGHDVYIKGKFNVNLS